MRTIIAASLVGAALLAPSLAWGRTMQECGDAYRAEKDKIDGVQSQADFMKACQAGDAIVPGATSAAKPAVPAATAARQAATPPSAAGATTKPAP